MVSVTWATTGAVSSTALANSAKEHLRVTLKLLRVYESSFGRHLGPATPDSKTVLQIANCSGREL
jgi:hypothetical protein